MIVDSTYPIDVVAIFDAKPSHEATLEIVLAACVGPSRAEPGSLSYVLHRDRDHPGRFVFIERWADDAAFAVHKSMPHFLALVDAVEEHIATPPKVMVVEQIG